MILLLALLGGGMWGGRGEASRTEDMLMNNMNSRFNAQEAAAEFRFAAQSNNINHISALEQLNDTDMNICTTQRMIQEEGHKNALIEKDTQLQMALGFKDAELQTAQCLTHRHAA